MLKLSSRIKMSKAKMGDKNPNWKKDFSLKTRKRISEAQMGEKNSRWGGDKITKYGLHKWVSRSKGKVNKYKCIDCGKKAQEWSNINKHVYRRVLTDYVPRCTRCHREYDKKYGKINKKKN